MNDGTVTSGDKPKEKNLHEGHRSRMRNRFLKKGIYAFEDYEVLEFLLYYVIKRRNTNLIAHELINKFHGLEGVFRAPYNELTEVDGIGDIAAVFIKFIGELKGKMIIDSSECCCLENTSKSGEYCCKIFNCLEFERFVLISLNSKRMVIGCDIISDGNDNSAHVDIRKVVDYAIKRKASGVILAHNHPGDTTQPSANDIALTNKIISVLEAMDICVIDHIICSGSSFTSMSERGLMDFNF